jgi:hypothetical protein
LKWSPFMNYIHLTSYFLEMFTDQIPNLPRRLNVYGENAKPWLANPVPILPALNSRREVDDTMTEGWGLTFSLSHNQYHTGRAPGSASWEGLANLFWFADRENGIGGIIASQILPYGGKFLLCLHPMVTAEA